MTKPVYFTAKCAACRNAFVVVDYAPIHCPACGEHLDASSQLGVGWCVNDSPDTRITAVNRSRRMVYVSGPASPTTAEDERNRILRILAKAETSERKAGRYTEAAALRAAQDIVSEGDGELR